MKLKIEGAIREVTDEFVIELISKCQENGKLVFPANMIIDLRNAIENKADNFNVQLIQLCFKAKGENFKKMAQVFEPIALLVMFWQMGYFPSNFFILWNFNNIEIEVET